MQKNREPPLVYYYIESTENKTDLSGLLITLLHQDKIIAALPFYS